MPAAPLSSWQVFRSVIAALVRRELKTRFGPYRLGYAWALIEPGASVALFTVLFGLRSRQIMPEVPYALFVLTGVLPYQCFSRAVNQCASAVEANEGLLIYRQVRPFDVILARILVEAGLHAAVLALWLCGCAWLGMDVLPADPLAVVAVLASFAAFITGTGLVVGVAGALQGDLRKSVAFVTRPLFFVSGVFIPLALVPADWRPWLTWNPVLHHLELLRTAWFAGFPAAGADPAYAAGSAVAALAAGAFAYRAAERRLRAA